MERPTVRRYDTVTFLSDYGTTDESVGVVTSVIRTLSPHATVVDLTHAVPVYDIRAGSLALVRSAPYLAPGIVLAIVDAQADQRLIAVEVGDGESVLVGPDNGLLAPVAALVGGPTAVVEIAAAGLPSPAPVFPGRDLLAPSVALLCNGAALGDLGPPVDPAELAPALVPFSTFEEHLLLADVLWVDQYGNVQTNVTAPQLDLLGERAILRTTATAPPTTVRRVVGPTELGPTETGLTVDAHGLAALVKNKGSAAAHLGLEAEATITLEPVTE